MALQDDDSNPNPLKKALMDDSAKEGGKASGCAAREKLPSLITPPSKKIIEKAFHDDLLTPGPIGLQTVPWHKSSAHTNRVLAENHSVIYEKETFRSAELNYFQIFF